MSTTAFVKDPADLMDYTVDFSAWLGTDTITGTPVWSVPGDLTKTDQYNDTTKAIVWLSGGTHGNDHLVSAKINTAGGRTKQVSLKIQVRER